MSVDQLPSNQAAACWDKQRIKRLCRIPVSNYKNSGVNKMSNDPIRSTEPKKKAEGKRRESVSFKIILSVLAVLIPSLVILIVISCIMTAHTIAELNDKVLDAQTDYAVSVVDDFFSGKVTAISMYEEDENLKAYFNAVSKPEDIDTYENRDQVVKALNDAMKKMSGEMVQQIWVADTRTDSYLFSDGQVTKAELEDTEWCQAVLTSKNIVISDPYLDPASKEMVVSVVTPVVSDDGSDVIGMMGFDVYLSSLSELLSGIEVGEEGYLELISNSSNYIYSNDPTAMGRNVTDLEISDDYKKKVIDNYNGRVNFSYFGTKYTAMFRNSETTNWLAIATLPISEVNATRDHLIAVMVILSVIILAMLVGIIVFIIRKRMEPLAAISSTMEGFSQGNLDVSLEAAGNDEIGRLAESVRSSTHSLKEMIEDASYILGEISTGNLDVEVKGNYVGYFRFIREALEQIISSLNFTLGQINVAAEQVSAGSEQVSAGAQSLSQGASEQAGTVEGLAVSIGEISQQITLNAGSAEEANKRAYAVGNEAANSNRMMQDMLEAMEKIRSSSDEISSILKTIEDIAFQTNILALNASVEAARAGEMGRGFAVVAGEVRNLATKSAEASKETAVLIENSMEAVKNGIRIAEETAKSMENVAEGVRNVVKSIDEISEASNDQARSVEQVTDGIEQISSVVQVNSATAEESAAASEELSAQALLLKELIGRFHLKDEK